MRPQHEAASVAVHLHGHVVVDQQGPFGLQEGCAATAMVYLCTKGVATGCNPHMAAMTSNCLTSLRHSHVLRAGSPCWLSSIMIVCKYLWCHCPGAGTDALKPPVELQLIE